jgi:exopolyphosphatase/guanosine-5'-triphosphate,3'-diphosphate pyrophosphatase
MGVVAIDLGSNTLRVLKYECSSGKRLAEYEKIVRTANSLQSKGIVDDKAIEAILSGLQEANKKIDFSGSKVRAVTTEALRAAKNAAEVLELIKKDSGIDFEVIAPEVEAKLTLDAVKSRLEILGIEQNFVLVDIGGGSTELSFYLNGHIVTKSFRLGIVTVANEASSLDEIKEIVALKAKEIAEFAKEYLREDLLFVATAGTPTTIAAMKLGMNYQSYNPYKINGAQLRREELEYYLSKLLDMSKRQREIAVGVGRDDLIVAGVIIFEEIYKILDKDEAIIIDDGLREGVALSLCREQGSW